MNNDNDTTIAQIRTRIDKFREDRGWGTHHVPQNIAMSISIEAAELLEHFQWGDYAASSKDEWETELADIVIYAMTFASVTGIDLTSAINRKLDKAEQKYPVSIFNKDNDPEEEYQRIKKEYRAAK